MQEELLSRHAVPSNNEAAIVGSTGKTIGYYRLARFLLFRRGSQINGRTIHHGLDRLNASAIRYELRRLSGNESVIVRFGFVDRKVALLSIVAGIPVLSRIPTILTFAKAFGG